MLDKFRLEGSASVDVLAYIKGGSASVEMRIYYSTSQPIKRGW